MPDGSKVIDCRVRFLRSNPELLAYARLHAHAAGRSVDELLVETALRVAPLPPPSVRVSAPRLVAR
jgi:hypothetical protein